jgi:tetratricopeptide (TPR) repeat protein
MIYAPDSLIKKGLYKKADGVIESILRKEISHAENHEFLLMRGKVKGYLLQHELAKNLLFTSLEFFKKQNKEEKVAECLNHLAITFLRNGEIEEAKAFLNTVRPFKDHFSLIVELAILFNSKDFEGILNLPFPSNVDAYVTANFHNYRAVAYRTFKQIDEALENYRIAEQFFGICEHYVSIGIVNNNQANTYLFQNNFEQAHFYVNKALEIFKKYENQSRYASALDTKANIYFNEKKYDEALEFINKSIEILNTHKGNFYLLESYETKIKICLAMKNHKTASETFKTAVFLAQTYCGEEWTNKFTERFANIIPKLDRSKPVGVFLQQELSKLKEVENKGFVFPEDYESCGRHFIVETTNNLLFESFGIGRNSLLTVAETAVKAGNLIAVLENDTQTAIIGTLQNEFGVTALEIPGYMPIFLDEKHKILGKIIGIGEVENEQIIVKVFY